MKNYLSILIAIILLVVSSCQESLTESKIREIENEINEISELSMKHFIDRDTANAYKYYSNDFSLLSEGLYKMKPGDLKNFIPNAKQTIATRDAVIYEITESQTEVLSPTVANHYFTYNRRIDFNNDITYKSPVACTWTFLKETDGWKIRSATISYPLEHYRAKENDKVWVIINTVKTEKKELFEKFMHDVFFDAVSEDEGLNKFLVRKTRILHPAGDNENGTSTYIFIMDPLIEGADYSIYPFLVQKYGEEKAKKYLEMWKESVAKPQIIYMMVQSRH